jgi:SAM-dependent methyltransferase
MLKQLRRSNLAGASLWQEHWRQFDEIRFDADSIRWDGFLDIIDSRISQGRILEAGCGLGRYLLYLRSRGARTAGVDFVAEPLRAIHQRVGPAPVAVADLNSLPFPPGTFATILCLGVIEHFEAGAAPVMRELVRMLQPGGALILTVPYANALKKWRAMRGGSNVVRVNEAVPPDWTFYQFCYGASELRAIMESAGLRPVTERRVGKMFSLVGWLHGRRTYQRMVSHSSPASTHAQAKTRAGETRVDDGGLMKRIAKRSALMVEPLLPAALLAHMVLAVGLKPREPADHNGNQCR